MGPSLTLAALVLLIWPTGHYQADVSLNPALDEIDRRRWRIALWCLLWSMTLYWLLHVRSQRAFDGRAVGAG